MSASKNDSWWICCGIHYPVSATVCTKCGKTLKSLLVKLRDSQ